MKRCPHCNILFWEGDDTFDRHLENHIRFKPFACHHCEKKFLKNHRRKLHEKTCDLNPNRKKTNRKVPKQTGRGKKVTSSSKFILHETAFDGFINDWRYHFSDHNGDFVKNPVYAINNAISVEVRNLLKEMIENGEIGGFKWYLALQISFHKVSDETVVTDPPPWFRTHPKISFSSLNLDDKMEEAYQILMAQIDEFLTEGSGWVIEKPIILDVKTVMYDPLKRISSNESGNEETN